MSSATVKMSKTSPKKATPIKANSSAVSPLRSCRKQRNGWRRCNILITVSSLFDCVYRGAHISPARPEKQTCLCKVTENCSVFCVVRGGATEWWPQFYREITNNPFEGLDN